jgi:protein-disulfide isomerase
MARAFFVGLTLFLLVLAATTVQTDSRTQNNQEGTQPNPVTNSASPGITKEQADAILNELREIHLLLQRQQQSQVSLAPPAPVATAQNVKITAAGGYSLGSHDASVTLVEFADYQCPLCKEFQTTVFGQLKRNFIDNGKVRFVSRDLPLDFHSNAFRAALAARCAGDQNNFWQMRDSLIEHSDNLTQEAVISFAQQLDLDVNLFQSCLDSGKHLPEVRKDISEAHSAGIIGTPSFVIGKSSDGKIEGPLVVGIQSYQAFERLLTERLSQPTALSQAVGKAK